MIHQKIATRQRLKRFEINLAVEFNGIAAAGIAITSKLESETDEGILFAQWGPNHLKVF